MLHMIYNILFTTFYYILLHFATFDNILTIFYYYFLTFKYNITINILSQKNIPNIILDNYPKNYPQKLS